MKLSIDSIDNTDDFYRMSYFRDVSALRDSLQAVGQLQPLRVEALDDGRLRVISGFRRLEAARKLGWQALWVDAISGTPEDRFVWFRQTLFENLSLRSFNWVEKAFVVQKLRDQFEISEAELLKKWFPTLGIGQNRKWLNWLLAIPGYEPPVQKAIAADALTFDLFEYLPALDGKSRLAMVRLFQSLNLGKNRQKEFFALLRDVALLEKSTLAELLQREEITQILGDESISLGQKTQRVRERLRRWRYPNLTKTEVRFRDILRGLRLPPGIQLRPPQNFEGDKFRLEFQFRTPEEFARTVAKLQAISESDQLQELQKLWEDA
ncbi:MAG: ParB N-terminal domain-containing protein [Calditrichaeota bacterium]|nr:ParB N-terminal domain-containing protein [Calditrichota bacterium]